MVVGLSNDFPLLSRQFREGRSENAANYFGGPMGLRQGRIYPQGSPLEEPMPKVLAYHRPSTITDALALLARSEPTTVVLAGGTTVNTERRLHPVEVVDVQALGLAGITIAGDRVRIGAATTLEALSRDGGLPPLLKELARRETSGTLRTLATVGGTVAVGDPESELLAGLAVYEAMVTVTGSSGETDHPLLDLVGDGVPDGSLITAVSIITDGTVGAERTGRTPGDRPIVAAVARRRTDGRLLLALTGVAPVPILVDPADPTQGLEPTADFRGSSEYRLHLAATLSDRVLARL